MELHRGFFRIVANPELQNGELKLPIRFVELYWKEMPNPIFLKLPNSTHKWKISWVERAGRIWLQKDWENFAKLLKYGYLLFFKYLEGSSIFEVKICDHTTVEIDYSNIKCVEEDTAKDEKSDDEDCVEILDEREIQTLQKEKSKKTNSKSHDETQGATTSPKAQKRKNNIDFNVNQEEVTAVKKAKKCSTKEAVKEGGRISHSLENPSFEIILAPSYIHGDIMMIPTWFSREHLKQWEGTATIRAANDMSTPLEVSIKNASGERSMLSTGWISFTQKYNLQVDDICKFEMTQRDPAVSFTITIPQAKVIPCPQQLHDLQGLTLNNVVKQNTFKISITVAQYPNIPNEFMKRHSRFHGKLVELKLGETSWKVKVKYYENAGFGRFSGGWRKFVEECKLKIGDTFLFELTDEEKLVFNVTRLNRYFK